MLPAQVETTQEEYRKKIRHAGMSAGGQKLEELSGITGKVVDELLALEKAASAIAEASLSIEVRLSLTYDQP